MEVGGRATARASFVVLVSACAACTLLHPLSGLTERDSPDTSPDGGVGRVDARDATAPSLDAATDAPPLTNGDTGDGACPCTLFGAEFRGTASDLDSTPTEVGVRFRSDVPGKILAIRYYRGPENLGPHVGRLWTDSGEPLATVDFTSETPSGWQTATFATPVPIDANTSYIASYRAPGGRYAATADFFAQALDAPPLHADVSAGLYTYGSGAPDKVYKQTNYWVDVVFAP